MFAQGDEHKNLGGFFGVFEDKVGVELETLLFVL